MEEVRHHLGKQSLTVAPNSHLCGGESVCFKNQIKATEDYHLLQAKSRKNGKGQLGETSTDIVSQCDQNMFHGAFSPWKNAQRASGVTTTPANPASGGGRHLRRAANCRP